MVTQEAEQAPEPDTLGICKRPPLPLLPPWSGGTRGVKALEWVVAPSPQPSAGVPSLPRISSSDWGGGVLSPSPRSTP